LPPMAAWIGTWNICGGINSLSFSSPAAALAGMHTLLWGEGSVMDAQSSRHCHCERARLYSQCRPSERSVAGWTGQVARAASAAVKSGKMLGFATNSIVELFSSG
jgi:hypothetical protein